MGADTGTTDRPDESAKASDAGVRDRNGMETGARCSVLREYASRPCTPLLVDARLEAFEAMLPPPPPCTVERVGLTDCEWNRGVLRLHDR